MAKNVKLTPVENELMQILWKIDGGSVRDVMQHLPKSRGLAYTSVSTMLRILQEKKFVRAIKDGRQHLYQPLIKQSTYAQQSVSTLINNMYSGNTAELVAHLVNTENLSLDDINQLQKLLDEKKKEHLC